MNHKRKRPKHQRAGCLLCKPWKDDRGVSGPTVRGWEDRLKASERRKLQSDE